MKELFFGCFIFVNLILFIDESSIKSILYLKKEREVNAQDYNFVRKHFVQLLNIYLLNLVQMGLHQLVDGYSGPR